MNDRPHRECDKCRKTKPPEGGIEMSPTKWVCYGCWVQRRRTAPRK